MAAGGYRCSTGQLLLVSNEIGWGVMPMSRVARQYGDLLGRPEQGYCRPLPACDADRLRLATGTQEHMMPMVFLLSAGMVCHADTARHSLV
jgi:hypothetical protein